MNPAIMDILNNGEGDEEAKKKNCGGKRKHNCVATTTSSVERLRETQKDLIKGDCVVFQCNIGGFLELKASCHAHEDSDDDDGRTITTSTS